MDNFAHEKNIFMGKDNLDWGAMKISSLFRKMFIPTLLGMMLACTMGIVDGVVVGQGVGSDALASVNIVAPFFLITTGFGLMFGTGGAIVASVYLSKSLFKNKCE
jgi:Na+-driven multidrug efflux pump